MDDVKDLVKAFIKSFTTSFTSISSSPSFEGHGRALGSSSSSSGSTTSPSQTLNLVTSKPPISIPNSTPKNGSGLLNKSNPVRESGVTTSNGSELLNKSNPVRVSGDTTSNGSELLNKSNPVRVSGDGFDPFASFITSGKRIGNGYSLDLFECPVCGRSYRSEEEVSIHVDSCVSDNAAKRPADSESWSRLERCVGSFLSGKPSQGSLEIVLKLLRNIVREPENSKFRRIRLGNPRIKVAIGEAVGGVELLEFVGFKLQEEEGEMWATMEVPTEEETNILSKVIDSIDWPKLDEQKKKDSPASIASTQVDELIEPKKVDRQIRVFFAVPENIAANIELPDSYKYSAEEAKREAIKRKQKLAESQLLVPKSYKEKQARAARRKYTRTVIRIQFPEGIVLQGVFNPREPTTALYEFVSASLKEPRLEFELINPVGVKRRSIAHFPAVGEKAKTLDDEELVPSALVKCRPIETDSVVFTGLRDELLEISEPLVSGSAMAPPARV